MALRARPREAVALLAEPFAERAAQLGCSGEATLEYRPRSRARDAEEFVAELQERLPGELERGFSGHGPHRDELVLLRDGRELRVYGSQGEQRLALLALLLAERAVLARERGRTPLMLLDDVMSELDSERRELLAASSSRGGQSVIATTDLAPCARARGRAASRACACPPARSCRRRWPHEPASRPAASRLALGALDRRARPGHAAGARAGGLGATRRAERSPPARARPPSATAC